MDLNTSIVVEKQATLDRAADDIDFFAALCLPDVMECQLPDYYTAIASLLVQTARETGRIEPVIRFALGLPRGFIKTTFIKILLVYFVVHDLCDFALVIGSTEFHAENIIADVDSILSSPNIIELYGSWDEARLIDQKSIKRSYYHGRPVIIAGLGAGSSIRGINIANRRPDFLICDDMQTKENDESPSESRRLFVWFVGTLLKVVDPKWCLIAYIGNMYSENCILYKLKEHPQWKSLITGCILVDGGSLWPEMHSVQALHESYKHDEILGEAATWFAEMMNDPVQSNLSVIPVGGLGDNPFAEDVTIDGRFLIIDPAGFRRTADENVLVVHSVIDQKGLIEEVSSGNLNPEEVIKEAIRLTIIYHIPVIGIESTGYQQTLKFWLDKYLKEYGLEDTVLVVPLETRKRSKDSRIITFFQEASAGNYFFRRVEDRQRIVYQALQYKVGKKNNKDDLLDGCAYGLDIRQDHWEAICNVFSPDRADAYSQARVQSNNTPI